MPILPREQVIQRHDAVVSAHGVVLWESSTNLTTREVETLNDVEAIDLVMASIAWLTGGSSEITDGGIVRGDPTQAPS